jgi:hypothetical protein
MAATELIETINSLTPEEQESVRQFVEFLKGKSATSALLLAAEEFIDQHPNSSDGWPSDGLPNGGGVIVAHANLLLRLERLRNHLLDVCCRAWDRNCDAAAESVSWLGDSPFKVSRDDDAAARAVG